MKICSKCKQEKDSSLFAKASRNKDGLQHHCKACNVEYRLENKEKILINNKSYYKKNKDDILVQKKSYYLENRQEILEYKQEYYENNSEELVLKKREYRVLNPDTYRIWASKNKDKVAAISAKRRANKLQATPAWLNEEQLNEIDFYYWFCRLISDDTGIQHHVDHIVPLQGKTVCGLHVPWNLQILSASENCSKSNKLI